METMCVMWYSAFEVYIVPSCFVRNELFPLYLTTCLVRVLPFVSQYIGLGVQSTRFDFYQEDR